MHRPFINRLSDNLFKLRKIPILLIFPQTTGKQNNILLTALKIKKLIKYFFFLLSTIWTLKCDTYFFILPHMVLAN